MDAMEALEKQIETSQKLKHVRVLSDSEVWHCS
jgi:hypothetical protein